MKGKNCAADLCVIDTVKVACSSDKIFGMLPENGERVLGVQHSCKIGDKSVVGGVAEALIDRLLEAGVEESRGEDSRSMSTSVSCSGVQGQSFENYECKISKGDDTSN